MPKVDEKIKRNKSVREDKYEDHKPRGFNRKERREAKRSWYEEDKVMGDVRG